MTRIRDITGLTSENTLFSTILDSVQRIANKLIVTMLRIIKTASKVGLAKAAEESVSRCAFLLFISGSKYRALKKSFCFLSVSEVEILLLSVVVKIVDGLVGLVSSSSTSSPSTSSPFSS